MTNRPSLFRHTLSTAILLAMSSAGCTDNATGDDMQQPDPDAPDTTPPSIVSTMPAANAIGVHADAKITITFSEQMDPATVEAAYASTDLPLDQVAFEWGAGGTVLTITPSAELEYASGIGTDLSMVAARQYAITFGTEAKDLAGNAMTAPVSLSFATRRRMLASFPLDADLSRVIRDTTVLSVANPIWCGDNSTGQTYRSYLTFDLSTMPAGAEVESAQFEARQTAPSGTPYQSLGAIMAKQVVFATIADAAAAPALSIPGAFSEDATIETKRLDVSAQVQDDVIHRAERADRSQFRLEIDTATDGDGGVDTAVFDKTTFNMLAIYVAD